MAYTLVHIDDVEPSGPNGAVRFVRRALGVEAFGINRFDLPSNREGFEHDEAGTDQEEVSVVIAGSGHWKVDGEEVAVREGSFIRIDAGSTRCPVAGPDGLSFISVGSPRGAYTPHGPF